MAEHGSTCKKRYERAKAIRANFTWHWQEVADLVQPSRQFTFRRTPGTKQNLEIVNDTAPLAASSLAAALYGLLANPATNWYSLVTEDFDLRVDEGVRKFLYDATNRGLSYLASSASGFPTALHEVFLDLVSFGTGIMQASTDKLNMLRFNSRQLANFFMCENPDGVVDETFRRFELDAHEATHLFDKDGDVLPEEILDHFRDDKDNKRKWWFVHEVSRRLDRDITRNDPKNKPWSSIYFLEKTGEVIRESGFPFNIYITPRWSKSPEEVFGRSPAMMMLPTIKMANEMSRTVITAAQQAVAPPMLVPANGVQGSIRTAPHSITYTRTGVNQRPEPLFTGANIKLGLDMIEQVELKIERAFFLDALKLPELDRMTAEEVITRRQQGLLTASPVITRLNAERLSKSVIRTFKWQLATRRLGEVPDGLRNTQMKIDFRSPMAQSQKSAESGAVQLAIQSMVPLLNVDPSTFQIIDQDETARFLWNAANASPRLLRSREDVAALRQQDAQRQALEQQVALAGGAASAAKDAAAAGRDVAGG